MSAVATAAAATAAGTDVDAAAAAAAGDAGAAAVAGWLLLGDRDCAAGRADGEAGNASAHDAVDLLEVRDAAEVADRARRVHCSQRYPVAHAVVQQSPVAVAASLAAGRRLPGWPAWC